MIHTLPYSTPQSVLSVATKLLDGVFCRALGIYSNVDCNVFFLLPHGYREYSVRFVCGLFFLGGGIFTANIKL